MKFARFALFRGQDTKKVQGVDTDDEMPGLIWLAAEHCDISVQFVMQGL